MSTAVPIPTLPPRLAAFLTPRVRRALVWTTAVVLPVGAALLTRAMGAAMERNIFLLTAVAVTASAMVGGMAPGLVATAIAAVATDLLLLPPFGALAIRAPSDVERIVAFLVVMSGVSGLCAAFRRALGHLRAREAQLRQSESDLRMLLRHASDAIVFADASGRVLDANDMASTLTGYAHDELIGVRARDLLLPSPDAAPGDRVAAAGSASRRLRRRDGRVLDIEVSATRFPDGRILAIARDVTERRRMETELRQAQRVEALGQLAGGVAHDFNNIVAVIRASAELLRAGLPDAGEQREDADEIVLACDRAAALTRQLLSFSRRRQPAPTLVEPDAVVRDMQRMLAIGLGQSGSLALSLGATGALVVADRGQLEQVLMNLAVNARDAIGMRPGTLTVSTAVDAAAGTLHLTLADTGAGMDAGTLASAFEPFFTTKEDGRGTGLGLSTVRTIVERAGGTVRVTSEPGRGTTFHIALPVAEQGAGMERAA